MDAGLVVSIAGVVIAGLAGLLGVWMQRDSHARRTWAWVFSALILISTLVQLVNTSSKARDSATVDTKLSTVLVAMSDLASTGDRPALEQYVGAELAVQSRTNPRVVRKVQKRVAAAGGDPASVTRMASESQRIASGLSSKTPAASGRATRAANVRQPADGAREVIDDVREKVDGTREKVDGAKEKVDDVEEKVVDVKEKADDAKEKVDETKRKVDGARKKVADTLEEEGG